MAWHCRSSTRAHGAAALLAILASCCAIATSAAELARVERAPFGVTAEGEKVDVITLRNRSGMQVRLLTRGGTIIEISTPDRRGANTNVVLTQKDFLAADASTSFNALIGRFANRIAGGGGFTLDGVFYKLAGESKAGVVLHGGPRGFAARIWQASTSEHSDAAAVALSYVSADGENGFPGELKLQVTYKLDDASVLAIDYEASTTKPTVVNFTNHAYFNLGGHESGSVYGEWLQVLADRWTPTDERLVPTGEIATVAGTPFDFRKPALIRERVYSSHPQMVLARGLDHNLVLEKAEGKLAVAARLWDPQSGRQLEVLTTEPAVQIYSANNLAGSALAADGRTLRQGDGITFETQHFPDSPNKPSFPSTVLRPGETFRSTTQFVFSTDRQRRFFDPALSKQAR
jgi:aldose 1-epimerase